MTERPKFEEIDVERINVVEADGTLRMTIANGARTPDPLMAGTENDRTGTRGAGILFFGDQGFEIGGLSYGGTPGNGGSSLTFDRFGQDQTVMLAHHEGDGGVSSVLMFMQRPDVPLIAQAQEIFRAQAIEDEEERNAELKRLSEGHEWRMSLGCGSDGMSAVAIADTKGRARLLLSVGADDEPRIQFLDADGNVTFSLPPEA